MSTPTQASALAPQAKLLSVGLATALSAASGYFVLLLAARGLTATEYASWFVFWSAFGLATGALGGLLQETARAVRAASTEHNPNGAKPMRVGVLLGLVSAGIIVASAPLWTTALFAGATAADDALPLAWLFAAGVCGVAAQSALGGLLSAAYAWTPFAVLTVLDAGFRLAVAIGCSVFRLGPGWFAVAAVAGAGSWLLLLSSARVRALASATADVATGEFLRRVGAAVAAASASAVLVMGFPVLLKITTPGQLPEGAGALLLAVTLTRAPLLVPLNVFQGALVAWCTDRRDHPWRALATAAGAAGAVGACSALLSALLGPWLLRTVFHVAWPYDRAVFATLTFGAAMIAMLTCTGVSCLTTGRPGANALGWWVATLASLALLLLPLPLDQRISLALIVGPLAGMVVHLGALRGAPRL